ncbi:MAG TPA: DUF2852 domain-containing protein [Xanthobacteraceae bacterium]|jgi:hypothetical protein|nr:DUF2852 domain-containing protein [Xanthobacteraceae bacterium]
MNIAATLDDLGKPAWIALLILGFAFWWPLGLAVLAYLIWSGRMACSTHHNSTHSNSVSGNWSENRDRCAAAARRWSSRGPWRHSSGNRAFDEYREETLRRLEEEQSEFVEFLKRLRDAKDKAEFDQFLAERRRQQSQGPTPGAEPV